MSPVFALALQYRTEVIFWWCTPAKSDSHAPESPLPGEMCWVKIASLNPHIYEDTQTLLFSPCKCAGAQMYCAYSTNAYISTNTYTEMGPLSPAGALLAHFLHLTLIALTVQCNDGQGFHCLPSLRACRQRRQRRSREGRTKVGKHWGWHVCRN